MEYEGSIPIERRPTLPVMEILAAGRQLEMNTQDSDENALFRQEMRYPERGPVASPA